MCSAIINDNDFWAQAGKFLEVLVPVRVFLRYTDTRFSLACRVYEGFSNLQGKVEGLTLGEGFTETIRKEVVGIICEKWDKVHHMVHAAGYALDPSNLKVNVSANAEVWSGFIEVLDRLLTKEEKTAALLEYARYKKFDGLDEVMGLTDAMPPVDFWNTYCGHLPVLQQKVSPRVMDLRAGTRCVESHFSVMGAVHSKARPRLVNSRVRKLTAIVTNTKMLNAAAKPGFGAEEKEKAVEESDSDSDYATDTDSDVDLNELEAEMDA